MSRCLVHLGAYRFFIDHQHLVHTFVTNLRGPEQALAVAGRPVNRIIPLGVISGNVTVAFAVLSYADTLTITAIADPETCPDLARLREELLSAIQALTTFISFDPATTVRGWRELTIGPPKLHKTNPSTDRTLSPSRRNATSLLRWADERKKSHVACAAQGGPEHR